MRLRTLLRDLPATFMAFATTAAANSTSTAGFAAIIAITATLLTPLTTQAAHVCAEAKTKAGVEFRYCADSEIRIEEAVKGGANVIYFLHGMGASEESWKNLSTYRQVRNIWNLRRDSAHPVVISVSLGPLWLMTDTPKAAGHSLKTVFVDEIMPAIERRFAIHSPNRIALGESVGAFNAVQLLAKEPGQFQKIAMVCPAISPIGPLSSDDEINEYLKRHQPYVKEEWVKNSLTLIRGEFRTETDWLKHDPFMLLLTLNTQSPKLFVSCSTEDEHGFYEGAERFAREAREQGVRTTWVPIIGGSHCRQTEGSLKALADFLATP